jgi:threonine dehydratase
VSGPGAGADPRGAVEVLVNPAARDRVPGAVRTAEPLRLHRKLPGYAVAPLVRCPGLATSLGLAEVWVKDESWRLGLPAFKMLGASYAVYRALTQRLGHDVAWQTLDELRAALAPLGRPGLTAATDGNHGRAVARMARLLGLPAAIYVPEGTAPARIAAIEGEGAAVTVVPGDYDTAVRKSAQDAPDGWLVISDTSWPGYTQPPTWVVEGYSTIFAEAADQLAAAEAAHPGVVVVPAGGGALAAASVHHYKGEREVAGQPPPHGEAATPARAGEADHGKGQAASIMDAAGQGRAPDPGAAARGAGADRVAGSAGQAGAGAGGGGTAEANAGSMGQTAGDGRRVPALLGVEPRAADCVRASLRAGRIVSTPGPHPSIMAGLNCGTPSQIAWPLLAAGMDAMVTVDDGWARWAVRELAAAGITAGETGAAALAGLAAICQSPAGEPVRRALRLGPGSTALLLCTEGATDPAAWEQIVGHPPPGPSAGAA